MTCTYSIWTTPLMERLEFEETCAITAMFLSQEVIGCFSKQCQIAFCTTYNGVAT